MNPPAQWAPAIFMVFAIWIGLIYNNKRLDDFKEMMRADRDTLRTEVRNSHEALRAELLAQIRASEERILRALAEFRLEVVKEIADLSHRVSRLEEQRGLVRP